MRKPYCCESSRHMFDQYYTRQQRGSGDLPVYIGRYKQRGHGLGDILGNLFRRILPYFKTFAPVAMRTGANIVEDVSRGKSWKDSTMDRIPETISRIAFGQSNQSGSGIRRRKTKRKRSAKKSSKKSSTKRAKRDIFS
jgi:hypothetical protein